MYLHVCFSMYWTKQPKKKSLNFNLLKKVTKFKFSQFLKFLKVFKFLTFEFSNLEEWRKRAKPSLDNYAPLWLSSFEESFGYLRTEPNTNWYFADLYTKHIADRFGLPHDSSMLAIYDEMFITTQGSIWDHVKHLWQNSFVKIVNGF